MATFTDTHQDTILICPFNPDHTVTRRRYQRHVNECAQRQPASNQLAICNFNASHRIPFDDLNEHHQKCKDNGQYVREMVAPTADRPAGILELDVNASRVKCVDDWATTSDDVEPQTYLMSGLQNFTFEEIMNNERLLTEPVDPVMIGRLTKSQRKRFNDKRVEMVLKRRNEVTGNASGQDEQSPRAPKRGHELVS